MSFRRAGITWALFSLAAPLAAAPLPFFENYCIECHDADSAKGGFDLEALKGADWGVEKNSDQWERVLKRVRDGEMPPAKEENQPSAEERTAATAELHRSLMEKATAGGGMLQRLSRNEYRESIVSLLGIDFELPDEFPPDTVAHGFDNSASGLVLSPTLMEAYFDAATLAADGLFPPASRPVEPARVVVAPGDFTFAETAGRVVGDAIRMVVRTPQIADSCIWPAKFETRIPGKYKLRINASRFVRGLLANSSFDEPMKCRVYAQPVDQEEGQSIAKMRKLTEFTVASDDPETFKMEVELHRTEAPVLYFANALISRPTDRPPDDHLKTPTIETVIREMLTRDKRLFAVWKDAKIDGGLQRGSAWTNLKKLRDAPDLNVEAVNHSKEEIETVVQRMVKEIGFVDPVLIFQFYEEGAALQIHSMEIIGPFEVTESKQEETPRGTRAPLHGSRSNRGGTGRESAPHPEVLPE